MLMGAGRLSAAFCPHPSVFSISWLSLQSFSQSSSRSPLINLLDLSLHYDDDDYNTSTFLCPPATSLSRYDTIIDFNQELPEIDLTSPPPIASPTPPGLYNGSVPGLHVADESSNTPSPHHWSTPALMISSPASPNSRSMVFRTQTILLKRQDAEVVTITMSMCPPEGVDTIERGIAFQQECTGSDGDQEGREMLRIAITSEGQVGEHGERERDAVESMSDSGSKKRTTPDLGPHSLQVSTSPLLCKFNSRVSQQMTPVPLCQTLIIWKIFP
ncbi:hypothetical protein BDM02DRAFT_3192941 [Thelephora ganbajun]|uniref:Uncharacterized protein n=1 Tax=Thelephora ganbajun TaxID=370292 RepID=A0ACB6YZ85_THEGA|nr:hypothetical protein BDM02DRAFT_3192941 [Thelephora ganbajun]